MKRVLPLVAVAAVLLLPGTAAAKPHLRSADAKAIAAVLTRYVPAALERKDLRLAYELSGPQVRGGMTLKEWLKGDIPVYEFPARAGPVRPSDWVLQWAEPRDVGVDLFLQPRHGVTNVGPIAFGIDMVLRNGRWLVNNFVPQAMFSPAGKAPSVFSQADLGPSGRSADAPSGRLT